LSKTVAKTAQKLLVGDRKTPDNVHPIRPGPSARPEGCRRTEGSAPTYIYLKGLDAVGMAPVRKTQSKRASKMPAPKQFTRIKLHDCINN